MAGTDLGSLTKEPPLAKLDATIREISPGMSYRTLLQFARGNTHKDAPGLIRNRYLLINSDQTIAYDHFLSLAKTHGLTSPLVRKVMYFLWAYRDERIRRFVCEEISNKSGKWQVRKLVRKETASFFEKWLQPSTARKARSNFEFFLVETGIFNPQLKTVHLERDDGWLEQAAIAAAQHERDPVEREELLANPIQFLRNRNWLGLINFDPAIDDDEPAPILVLDTPPLEDLTISTEIVEGPSASDWNRPEPSSSGRKSTTANIDLVARERASKSHHSLERLLAELAKKAGRAPRFNQNIDMFFDADTESVLAEIKSCTDSNFHGQVRKAISQLFEYRFLYKKLFKEDTTLLLVLETKPPKEKAWLVGYARSLGILMAWKNESSDAIITTCEVPAALTNVVSQIET
jgi:hypothetical protein